MILKARLVADGKAEILLEVPTKRLVPIEITDRQRSFR